MKINKLLSMICDPVKRQMLVEFRVIRFCLSNQVSEIIDDKEEEFYKALSKLNIDENGFAEASFFTFRLFISVIELESELDSKLENKQSESTTFLHVVAINEELERDVEKQSIQEFLGSGEISIE
jgi:hypothetical protein